MTSTPPNEADLASLPSFAHPNDPARLHPAIAVLAAFGARWIRVHISEDALPVWGEGYRGRLGKIKQFSIGEKEDLILIKWRKRGESVARPHEVVYAPWPEDGISLTEHRARSGHGSTTASCGPGQ